MAELQLERVVGMSPPSPSSISFCPAQPALLAYPAGCLVVLLDTATRSQARFLRSRKGSRKPLACIAWAHDGSRLAAGECGPSPTTFVFDAATGRCLHELKGHKHGVACVAFSRNGEWIGPMAAAARIAALLLWRLPARP